jgi:hypothetical protein
MEQPREPAGQPEGGQFAGEEGASVPETEPAPQAAAGEKPAPAEPEATAAGEKPAPEAVSDKVGVAVEPTPTPGVVKIPLSDNHPLRSRGFTEWETAPELETETRGMLSAVERQADSQARANEIAERNMVLEARLRAQQGEMPYRPTPEWDHIIDDLTKTYSPEVGAAVRQGLEDSNTQHLAQTDQQAATMVAEGRIAQMFVGNVKSEAASRLPVWAKHGELVPNVSKLIDQYSQHVDARNVTLSQEGQSMVAPNSQEFFQWLAPLYANDPRVQQSFKDEQNRVREEDAQRIRAEERSKLAQSEKERLTAAAVRHGQRPPSTSSHSSSGNTAAPNDSQAVVTGPNRRTAIRRSIAQRYSSR